MGCASNSQFLKMKLSNHYNAACTYKFTRSLMMPNNKRVNLNEYNKMLQRATESCT